MSRWLRTALKQEEFDFNDRKSYTITSCQICDLSNLIRRIKGKSFPYVMTTLKNYTNNMGNWKPYDLDFSQQNFTIDAVFKDILKLRTSILYDDVSYPILKERAIYEVKIEETEVDSTKQLKENGESKICFISRLVSEDKIYDNLSELIDALTNKIIYIKD